MVNYLDENRFSVGLRTGAQYTEAIKNDGRRVFIDGKEVRDVTIHPAFSGAVRTIARLYDISSDPKNCKLMTHTARATGEVFNYIWCLPRDKADLNARRGAIERWSEATFGLMGRSPDHVAGFFAGWAMAPDVFARNGSLELKQNLIRFYEFARARDIFITYTIIPPQIDRSKPMHMQNPPDLYAGAIDERDNGIIIRGAQMLGTGTALSDYLNLSQITPVQPGDDAHALNLVVPCNAPGLKIYSRRSYASAANSVFDYPLATRFDETDSLVVFDDVFVPWEQVFVYKDIDTCRDQWWKTPAHAMGNHQSQIRLVTKLRLLMGLARRVSEMNGVTQIAEVQTLLGEMGSYAAMMEGLVDAQIATCITNENGYVEPGRQALYAAIVLQSEAYPRMLEYLRELCGGGVIQLPSSVTDFTNPETRIDIERYIQSPQYPAIERVKLLKMIWELIGSEFAGRQEQYEKFYAGPPFVVKKRMAMEYNFNKSDKLVNAALAGYDLDGRCD